VELFSYEKVGSRLSSLALDRFSVAEGTWNSSLAICSLLTAVCAVCCTKHTSQAHEICNAVASL
jgi:hypothetical protein